MRSQVDGRIDKVLFREGQRVHRGQSLARIDARPFLVQLHQAQGALARDTAQLQAARKNLARLTSLAADKLVATQSADDQAALVGQLEGTTRSDRAAVESARLNLDYARVPAPIDGVVGVRLVDSGNLVRAGDPAGGLVLITQNDPAAIFVSVPQDELGRIVLSQARGPVVVEVRSREGGTPLGTGQLIVIDNQINQSTSTLRLKARVDNQAGRMWPNQFVKARLLVDTRRGALVVPAAAVARGPQGTFVFVVTGAADAKRAEQRPVVVDAITTDEAIVTSGVAAGDAVVVEGQGQLRPGALVTARDVAAPPPGQLGPAGPGPSGPRPNSDK